MRKWRGKMEMPRDEIDPDPETISEMWADRAPPGWVRCPGCGEQWGSDEESGCKCHPQGGETEDEGE